MINQRNGQSSLNSKYFKKPNKFSHAFIQVQYDNYHPTYGRPKTNDPFQKYQSKNLCVRNWKPALPYEDESSFASIRPNDIIKHRELNTSNGYTKRQNYIIDQEYKQNNIPYNNIRKHILPNIISKPSADVSLESPKIMIQEQRGKKMMHSLENSRRCSLENESNKINIKEIINDKKPPLESELVFHKRKISSDCKKTNNELAGKLKVLIGDTKTYAKHLSKNPGNGLADKIKK